MRSLTDTCQLKTGRKDYIRHKAVIVFTLTDCINTDLVLENRTF